MPFGMQAISVPDPEEPDDTAAAQHKRQGDEAFVKKDFKSAEESYSRSLRHSTSSHLPWANRSAAYLHLGKPELALQDAQIARTIDPKYAKVCSCTCHACRTLVGASSCQRAQFLVIKHTLCHPVPHSCWLHIEHSLFTS